MSSVSDLSILLHGLAPELHPGEFVYCTLDSTDVPATVEPVAAIREAEGLTLVLPRIQAEQLGLGFSFPCAWITLTIHSNLEAVGLTPVVSKALAANGIACNIIAGYYHDHLFVPFKHAERAMNTLISLAAGNEGR